MRKLIRLAGLGALVIGGGLCFAPQAQATAGHSGRGPGGKETFP